MTSELADRQTPCPSEKRRYSSRLDAALALTECIKRGHGEIRYYFCMLCRGYHLSSQPKRGRE